VEVRYDYPPKRRYLAGFGRLDNNILVIEIEWPSIKQMEEYLVSILIEPDEMALAVELRDIVEYAREEIYLVRPPKM